MNIVLLHSFHIYVTDDEDILRKRRVKFINEINNGDHKGLIKGLLQKIIRKHCSVHAASNKIS